MRSLNGQEIPLVAHLLSLTGRTDGLSSLQVEPMSDGGMGSLRIGGSDAGRQFGESIAEAKFADIDGVLVSAVLTVDSEGYLFEVDIWRVDFNPLLRWPKSYDIEPVLFNSPLHPTAFGVG